METFIKVACSILILTLILSSNLLTMKQLFVLLSFALLLIYSTKSNKNGPPGPLKFPIIGCLYLFLRKEQDRLVKRLHEKYGPIIDVSIGSVPVYSIGDYEVIKEIGLHPEFQLRPDVGLISEIGKDLGVVASEGQLWKHQRRFVLHALRDSGMGRLRLQEKVQDELKMVVEGINEFNGHPMSVHGLLEKSTCNIIFALAFDKRFDYDNPDFIKRIDAVKENFEMMAVVGVLSLFKWLRPFIRSTVDKLHRNFEIIKEQSVEFIEEHRRTFDPDNPRDFLDLYLKEMHDGSDDEYHNTFFEEQLKHIIVDLFGGATETSSTTIRWALLFMIHHPGVQTKVQQEIDEVVGRERLPDAEDRNSLPYTVATLQEIERLSSVIATALPRSNDKPVEIHGYTIPPRSIVNFSLYAVHHDSRFWHRPDEFNPSRFIGADGKVFRPPHLIPFGTGKRMCPGESLARMEIFLFFTVLLHKFRFKSVDGEPLPSLSPSRAVTRGPNDYKLRCLPRD